MQQLADKIGRLLAVRRGGQTRSISVSGARNPAGRGSRRLILSVRRRHGSGGCHKVIHVFKCGSREPAYSIAGNASSLGAQRPENLFRALIRSSMKN